MKLNYLQKLVKMVGRSVVNTSSEFYSVRVHPSCREAWNAVHIYKKPLEG